MAGCLTMTLQGRASSHQNLPTTVSNMLSSSRAMATMTRTSCREPRHCSVHRWNRPHAPLGGDCEVGLVGFTLLWLLLLTGLVTLGAVVVVEESAPVKGLVGKTPPGSVDCISTSSGRRERDRSVNVLRGIIINSMLEEERARYGGK